MAAARKLSASDKARHLRNLPEGTTRVQVIDDKGKQGWRKPADVSSTDQIVFGNKGPVVMRGTPGRKAKPQLAALSDGIAEVIEAKEVHLKDDALTGLIVLDPDHGEVLDTVMRELAQEASSLEFERKEAERNGNDTSTYSLRRARILQAIADIHLKRKKLAETGGVDLDSKGFEAVFGFMLETVRETMGVSGIRPELIETTFAKLGKTLEAGWKEEARILARNAE